jgi:DNA-binding response OmpR family regulator
MSGVTHTGDPPHSPTGIARARNRPDTTPMWPAERADEPGDERPLVLVADDDDDIRALVSFRLERSGYAVLAASDGEEALGLALEHHPRLAVLDVMMPKLDGYQLTRRLRELEETRRMPVILLTARAQEADVARGFEAGADDYIRKPFSPHELRARVQAILGRR